MTTRTSSAEWRGDLQDGEGNMSLASGAYTGQYTYASRFEEGEGTNPEELIAAAHAGCFSMFLAGVLGKAGAAPTSIRTEATAHLERVDGKPRITRIELSTEGEVPGIDQDTFLEHAQTAKEGCPVSNLVTGATITLEAKLLS